jgi:hypothetical protein
VYIRVGMGNDFLYRVTKTQETKAKIGKYDYTKLKYLFTAKEMITGMKTQPPKCEKIFVSYSSDRDLISIIYKGLKKFIIRK